MTYESAKRFYSQNKHEKDPYVWKSKPPSFAKAKHDMQKIDKLVSNLPSFYKLDIWDEYASHSTEEYHKYISQVVETTRAMSVGILEFRNGPNGGINMTMAPRTEKGPKQLYIYNPPRCGKTLAMECYKQFCDLMEESKMNNNINKNLNDDLNNINWVVESWEVEDRPVAGVYRPCDFKVSLSGRFNNNAARLINFYRLTNSLADKLNDKTCNANSPTIKNVIFNDPATIVFWGDGSKTVVKCQDGEEFDPEKGMTMAFFKKMHGNKGHYFEEIKKWTHKYAMSLFKDEVHTMKDEKIEEVVEAGMSKPTDTVWVLFYARADRGEDEGYTQHHVVYKHKSSAVRAAKRLISKLPSGVDYDWFVDEK